MVAVCGERSCFALPILLTALSVRRQTAVLRILTAALTFACLPAFVGFAQSGGQSVLEGEKYLLRYKLHPEQQLHYTVTHVAKTKTRIQGTEEVTQVHTISQRHWDVIEKKDEGLVVFDHIVDAVEMTQKAGEAEELRWNSREDDEAPKLFSVVAGQIGKTISTITVNERGQEKERENNGGSASKLGMGSLTLAMPKDPMPIGGAWSIPRELKAKTDDGLVKTIKILEKYELKKVKTGIATIAVRSEPITPIDSESVRAQVIQQLSDGTLRFDIDNGYMLSKQLDWDETVVGFQGPNSMMEYRARMTEELVPDAPKVARLKKPTTK